jgi:hypothetical protein
VTRSSSFRRLGTLGAVLGALLAAGAASTSLAATETVVDCGGGADLQAAINAAPKGAILDISGTCRGVFTVGKNLTLKGMSAAVLDAGSTSTGPSTSPTLTITAGHVQLKTLTLTGAHTVTYPIDYGALLNDGTAVLNRVVVEGNTSDGVAGITNRGTITLLRSTVTANETTYADGATISNSGTATIDRSTVASNFGTGIVNGGRLTVVDSTVSGNELAVGIGGISNGPNGIATIVRSTVSKNSVGNDGPGAVGNAGSMTIVESTISDNFGDGYSGGLFTFDGGTTTVAATILSGNMYDNLASDCGGALVSAGYNLIGSPTADEDCTLTARPTDQTGVLNPVLKPLGTYGGRTQTMVPKTTSPAVNKIPVGATSADGTVPLCPSSGTTDQRGIPRPQSGACDVGAVERKPKE